ncbi:Oxaloacetate decarboxylase beta chain (EC [Lentimonas sp. CC4]|uniref:sodium ion-translocating decarboxylase subunit beta n=2 Tax=unclassified Lentimonas TaxID=2630993 RepID=UPI0013227E32|nr:Oxaloacetate decarboxylase beta chain (EC [Lentimonas sp. CC4]CAA6684532.1 Oxaloacetate decarboxylase beta chain (EC [Lentimonas sp. CC6]CAA7077390.1 Oxaloacetate decarboxylase beta chain (EC [Lentimonas sp. CC4]CAA7171226.1 Oxaloacetate decarboxylase beta chain (EC [Lentimonas sp. CC21]CAA7183255.1 Oxaloacetate decarboxylase beta chain (EC [Lentimonas sp. CC8]
MIELFEQLYGNTGFAFLDWRMLVMWVVVAVLLYLAVYKKFEPLLLVPIAFGAMLANLPTQGIINKPASVVRAPVSGEVLVVGAQEGQTVQLNAVEKVLPETAGDLGAESLVALLAGEQVGEYGTNTLLYVMRDRNSNPAEDVGTLLIGDVSLVDSDVLVWADATGRVVSADTKVGDALTKGAVLTELNSEHTGGLFHYIQLGILLELFPPLIFLGVGALTDFGPLIANPRMLLLGGAAQFGVFATFIGAQFLGFSDQASGAIGIIGGADGPTSIFLANSLAPELLAPIAVAAYSYMALVPVIQPPIMRALTTKAERKIRMKSLRKVSRLEKLVFAVVVTVACILLVPPASPLIGMLMFGNFLRECNVTERLSKAAQNELINVITIFLGTSVGVTMTGDRFLRAETLGILLLGIVAFGIATSCGVLMAKAMNVFSKNKINPLIGSAGVSAVPMAARVSQVEGQKADPSNFLLMHAMGPNVAGVIGTALVAGFFLTLLSNSGH